ncbi:MAG: DUF4255 domain-containing protein [Acidobacteriia bacterium]|nr:DUF4255 domain-containing protein [Terriglobia bacterium]
MSSPLAIAAVTATLKDLLNDGLLNHDLSAVGSVTVSSTAPDRITTGANEANQLNLFLYQVTPNLGWRNVGLPSRDGSGQRLANPPLALDLHYLLTAYGAQDFNAEILLGYAMQLLHETPVLTRAQLRTVLGKPSPVDGAILPPLFKNLPVLDLADQVELIKIAPVFLSSEELSKLWTAMQARYRTTMAYLVSVVLIQSTAPVKAAPPVLKQGKDDSGPSALAAPFPTLTAVRPALSELLPAMRLGDDLKVTGSYFDNSGTTKLQFENAREKVTTSLPPKAVVSPTEMSVHVPSVVEDPNAMNEWAIGVYSVSMAVSRPGAIEWCTNAVPVALAPLIEIDPPTAPKGDVKLNVTCTPRLLPDQEPFTQLIFGSQTVSPEKIETPKDDLSKPTILSFTVPGVVAGEYLVRLRVQGVDSLSMTVQGDPPKFDFDPKQKVKVT